MVSLREVPIKSACPQAVVNEGGRLFRILVDGRVFRINMQRLLVV
jgi:hypothetical protein